MQNLQLIGGSSETSRCNVAMFSSPLWIIHNKNFMDILGLRITKIFSKSNSYYCTCVSKHCKISMRWHQWEHILQYNYGTILGIPRPFVPYALKSLSASRGIIRNKDMEVSTHSQISVEKGFLRTKTQTTDTPNTI
jgi:hypothetical protein